MLYTKEVNGPVSMVVERLQKSVKDHRFGVLGRIDLKAKMAEKGVPFERECVILEVCNPAQAKRVLDHNMAVSTSLPCRISVYEQAGTVTIATLRPTALLKIYQGAESLAGVAREVEDAILAMMDEAASGEGRAT